MSELIYTPIPVRISFPEELTPEDCKKLLEINLDDLIVFIDYPIRNIAELQLEAFKEGFEWIKEKGLFVFTYYEKRILKINWHGKWGEINPNLFEMGNTYIESFGRLLESLPDTFSFFLNKLPITRENLLKQLIPYRIPF